MIGYIQGEVIDSDGKKAIILAKTGIGYEINYGYFSEKQKAIKLFIHHHVSENDQSLWGFNTLEDKKMFELLKTVNKVGSSKAYPLITNIGTDQLIQAISFEQVAVLTKAPGIGKKMAEQIILSLKDKIEKFQASNQIATVTSQGSQENLLEDNPKFDSKIMNDAILALASLGYKDGDIASLVKQQMASGLESSEDIIKSVLREI